MSWFESESAKLKFKLCSSSSRADWGSAPVTWEYTRSCLSVGRSSGMSEVSDDPLPRLLLTGVGLLGESYAGCRPKYVSLAFYILSKS